MPYQFKARRTVEFAETDMAGIVHFSNFFRYMEATEHAFLRSLGESGHRHTAEMMSGWPRTEASCRYIQPLRYEDEIEIELLVRSMTGKSVTYDFVFRKVDDSDAPGPAAARGTLTVVHINKTPADSRMRVTPMPESLASRIEVAPPELLEQKVEDR